MKNAIKKSICALLCGVILFCFVGCSGPNADLTEKNVTKTVECVTKALQEYDQETLEKYVDSSTLKTIFKFGNGKKQFTALGKAIFGNLKMEIKSINLEEKTVTVKVKNKKLDAVASDFTNKLLSDYSTAQLLTKLTNERFLNESLADLLNKMNAVNETTESTVTLKIKQKSDNLVLSFDENAEDAVSGGALSAITSVIG